MKRESRAGLLGRLINRPLLATPDMVRQYLGVIARDRGLEGILIDPVAGTERPLADLTAAGVVNYAEDKIFPTVPGTGIAVINVSGGLVHKSGYVGAWCGVMGYDGIEAQLEAALQDQAVRGIMLDVNSCGGEVPGCFDLADRIRQARSVKPIWAIADEMAYSAAFALSSQVDFAVTPRTGGVGSVGIVWLHADFSGQLAEEGIKVTLIHAGAHKVDGNPYEPLAPEVQATVQKEAETTRTLFAQIVSAGCGISAADVLATEAACLTADEALSVGFIDAIMSSRDTYAAFAEYLSGAGPTVSIPAARAASPAKENKLMAKRNGKPGLAARIMALLAAETGDEEGTKTPSEEMADQPTDPEDEEEGPEQPGEPADPEDENEDPEPADKKAAATERRRIAGILNSPHAKGREKLAKSLALETYFSVSAAEALLKNAAVENRGSLAGHMEQVPNAEVGAGGGAQSGDETSNMVASILGSAAKAKGSKKKAA